MREGLGRIVKVGKSSIAVRLPLDVVKDSTFPFQVGQKVKVCVIDHKIEVSKEEKT